MSEEEQHDGLSRMESVLGQKASALRHRDGMLHMIASKRGSPGGRVVLTANDPVGPGTMPSPPTTW